MVQWQMRVSPIGSSPSKVFCHFPRSHVDMKSRYLWHHHLTIWLDASVREIKQQRVLEQKIHNRGHYMTPGPKQCTMIFRNSFKSYHFIYIFGLFDPPKIAVSFKCAKMPGIYQSQFHHGRGTSKVNQDLEAHVLWPLEHSWNAEARVSWPTAWKINGWFTSWWLNQPLWKICANQNGFIFPK